jgi:threonine dehydrogenase-like Zn-dependent dehydrogenase
VSVGATVHQVIFAHPDNVKQVSRAANCGSDLWPHKSMEPTDSGRRMDLHERVGRVDEVVVGHFFNADITRAVGGTNKAEMRARH